MDPQTPQAPVPSVPAPEVKPSAVKNSLLVIMAICLLIATGLAGLFYFQIQKLSKELSKYQTQPSPTPTAGQALIDDLANWKTYINTRYKYSFKYPNIWDINNPSPESSEEQLSQLESVAVFDPDSIKSYLENHSVSDMVSVSVELFRGGGSTDIITCEGDISEQSCIQSIINYFPTYKDLKSTKITLDGKNAIRLTYQKPSIGERVLFLIDKQVFVISIFPEGNSVYDENLKNIFNQILSTFKFLE